MFFVSEEFLRSYSAGDDIKQTIDEAVPEGKGLFDVEYKSKAHKHPKPHGSGAPSEGDNGH